jgi:hypothetical protein
MSSATPFIILIIHLLAYAFSCGIFFTQMPTFSFTHNDYDVTEVEMQRFKTHIKAQKRKFNKFKKMQTAALFFAEYL